MRATLLVLLVASACSATRPKDADDLSKYGRPPSAAEAAIFRAAVDDCLAASLKDPDSRRVRYGELVPMWVSTWGETAWTGTRHYFGYGMVVGVNARNSFGGYTGERAWVFHRDVAGSVRVYSDGQQSSRFKCGYPGEEK